MAREGLRVRYSLRASVDMREYAEYYEARVASLAPSFLACVRDAEQLALSNPTGFDEIETSSGIRSIVIRRFPFRLLYAVRGNTVLILAVAHTARKPDPRFRRRSDRP